MKKIKLFCFPYAGGSAGVYTSWKSKLDNSIELRPVELSGRGRRYKLPLYENMEKMINDVYNEIRGELDTMPYVFFGHSMGSLIAYELYYKIKETKHNPPVHIFFSGHKAPHMKKTEKDLHNLSDEEFKKEILSIGGTPEELFDYPELVDLFIPILRADYKVVDTYKYKEKDEKIDCNISIFNGEDDIDEICDLKEWKIHTSKGCKEYLFRGGHFFINQSYNKIGNIINTTLSGV